MGSTRQALGLSKSHTAADAARIAAIAADSSAAHRSTPPSSRVASHTTTLLPNPGDAMIRADGARAVRILLFGMQRHDHQTSRTGWSPGRFIVASSP